MTCVNINWVLEHGSRLLRLLLLCFCHNYLCEPLSEQVRCLVLSYLEAQGMLVELHLRRTEWRPLKRSIMMSGAKLTSRFENLCDQLLLIIQNPRSLFQVLCCQKKKRKLLISRGELTSGFRNEYIKLSNFQIQVISFWYIDSNWKSLGTNGLLWKKGGYSGGSNWGLPYNK